VKVFAAKDRVRKRLWVLESRHRNFCVPTPNGWQERTNILVCRRRMWFSCYNIIQNYELNVRIFLLLVRYDKTKYKYIYSLPVTCTAKIFEHLTSVIALGGRSKFEIRFFPGRLRLTPSN